MLYGVSLMSSNEKVVLIALAFGAFGCDDELPPIAPTVVPDAQMIDAGPRDMDSAGDGGPDGGSVEACAAGGPTVDLETPTPATDPVADEVVVGPFASVGCRVARSAGADALPVDPESVVIEMLGAAGEVLASPAVTAEGDLFRAQLNVAAVPNGPVTFRCTAFDVGAEPRCGRDEVATFVDNGPSIELSSPAADSIHRSRILLRYRVEPSPLADGDSEAEVASHTLVVAGAAITATREGDEWVADVDLEDRARFPERLRGAYELAIEATNSRTPEAATRRYAQGFTVDTLGPTIDIVSPSSGELVGGTVVVEATISDESNVDDSSVVLRAAGMDFPMTRVVGTDTFRASFDASVFPTTVVELTLNVTAGDVVGNSRTASLSVKLDAVAPILSLDPPLVREARTQGGVVLCSALFDPVGADSAGDGDVVGTTPELRVRAHDLANSSFGGAGTVVFYAGLDTVDVLVLDDTSVPFLVDQDSDGTCDAINPAVEPDPSDPGSAVLIQMQAISARGSAFYGDPDPTMTPSAPAGAYAGGVFGECSPGTATSPPPPICSASSDLIRVIERADSREATIYGKPPISADVCVGDSWDFAGAGVSEGWACVVARGTDELGNVGISPPLRICLTDGVGPNPCPGPIGTTVPEAMRPSCTDSCAPPASFADYPSLQQIGPAP